MARKSKFFRDAHGIQHRECPVCDGAGELVFNNTNPYGYGPDPQCDETETCFECMGQGTVRVTPVDALEQLRSIRSNRLFRPGQHPAYRDTRRQAMTPAYGLQHAEFMAKCDRLADCVRELRQQVAA